MLKQRILTALVLAPLVIWGVLSLPEFYFSLFILFLVGLASWEWGHLSAIKGVGSLGVFTLASVAATALLIWLVKLSEQQFYILVSISIVWWLYRVFCVVSYKAANDTESDSTAQYKSISKIKAATALSIVVSIVIPLYSIIYLRNVYNVHTYLLYLLLLIWGADIFAYFAGKYTGKNKLAPHVSPGKTWEGAYGAIAGTFLISMLGSYFFAHNFKTATIFLVVSLIIVIISIFGDLSESLYKRQCKLKDSGNLLPGHGGILDRIDSLIAAAPFYIMGLNVTGLLL